MLYAVVELEVSFCRSEPAKRSCLTYIMRRSHSDLHAKSNWLLRRSECASFAHSDKKAKSIRYTETPNHLAINGYGSTVADSVERYAAQDLIVLSVELNGRQRG